MRREENIVSSEIRTEGRKLCQIAQVLGSSLLSRVEVEFFPFSAFFSRCNHLLSLLLGSWRGSGLRTQFTVAIFGLASWLRQCLSILNINIFYFTIY